MKEISSKRHKTEADHEEMAKIEFYGGLYMNGNGPEIPDYVFEACLIGKGGAARKERRGMDAKAGLFVDGSSDLLYDGPRTKEELWENKRFVHQALVTVQKSRIVRTRPIFDEWTTQFTIQYFDDLVSKEDIMRWLAVAGEQVGLCDWRPRYGRFTFDVAD